MRREPIDFDSPLGISKKEWTRVLGVNLALLFAVYVIALSFTLNGSDFFLLNFYSTDLQRIENTLRGWGIYPLLGIFVSCIETFIIASYVCKKFPKWYFMAGFFALRIIVNVIFTQLTGGYPSFVPFVMNVLFVITLAALRIKTEKWWVLLCRFAISIALSLGCSELISFFRTKVYVLWNIDQSSSVLYAINLEYLLALCILLYFLTLVIKWGEKGGTEPCPMNLGAGGSSPTTTNSLRKNLKIAKTNLPPKIRKRLLWLKIKVIAIQTVALIVIAALPWFGGKPVEFVMVYASFCLTRFMLGFNRSLHFKSEMMCVTIGALTFWALTFLAPSAEASIIMSLVYGAGLAIGFRAYWELHDLMMYRKAAKTDRYAMLFVVFKGNCDPKHINGVMRARNYISHDDIKMVQMYMQREKVEYIAEWIGYAKITIKKRLTEIATDLYQRR